MEQNKVDMVNHPPHYQSDIIECIEVSRFLPHTIGNAVKYMWRYRSKGVPQQDVDKAIWYLNDFINVVYPSPLGFSETKRFHDIYLYYEYSGIMERLVQHVDRMKGKPEHEFFETFIYLLKEAGKRNGDEWQIVKIIQRMKEILEDLEID